MRSPTSGFIRPQFLVARPHRSRRAILSRFTSRIDVTACWAGAARTALPGFGGSREGRPVSLLTVRAPDWTRAELLKREADRVGIMCASRPSSAQLLFQPR